MEIALYYHGFLLKPITPVQSWKKYQPNLSVCGGGASNKIPPVPLKTVRVIKNKQHLRNQAGEEGDDRGWDGWMASPTQQTWVWADSRSWWWTGRPGVLRFMGSQRVGHPSLLSSSPVSFLLTFSPVCLHPAINKTNSLYNPIRKKQC